MICSSFLCEHASWHPGDPNSAYISTTSIKYSSHKATRYEVYGGDIYIIHIRLCSFIQIDESLDKDVHHMKSFYNDAD